MAIALSAGSTGAVGTDKPTAGDAAATGSASDALLMTLMQQLIGGGTPQMRQDKATKNSEITTAQTNREGYSKEAAFSDAQGLMQQAIRTALEKLIPSINSASLGAGSSASSMRALLTQKAAENASQNAAALGAKQAVDYGQINNQFTDSIARLLAIQDPSVALAIQAAGAKGGAGSGARAGGGVGAPVGTGGMSYEPYPLKPATNQGAANLPINQPNQIVTFGPAVADNAYPMDPSTNKPYYFEQGDLERLLSSPRFNPTF